MNDRYNRWFSLPSKEAFVRVQRLCLDFSGVAFCVFVDWRCAWCVLLLPARCGRASCVLFCFVLFCFVLLCCAACLAAFFVLVFSTHVQSNARWSNFFRLDCRNSPSPGKTPTNETKFTAVSQISGTGIDANGLLVMKNRQYRIYELRLTSWARVWSVSGSSEAPL